MNQMRRLFALMLCILIAAAPLECALAEGELIVIEATAVPTPEPTAVPTTEPTAVPTPEPTAAPTTEPTAEPVVISDAEPTAEPNAVPTPEPTAEPTAEPTPEPTPTAEPTAEITAEPVPEITAEPTAGITAEPTAVPAETPAVEATAVPETTVEPEVTATAEPTAEVSPLPSLEPTTEPSTEPSAEPSAEPSVEPEATPAVDYSQSAAFSPEFSRGYAQLLGEAMAYDGASPDAIPAYYLESGVLYVAKRISASECDRLEVHFDGGDGEITAWMDASSLRPMSEEECISFIQARSAADGVRFCCSDSALPLDAAGYSAALSFSLFSATRDTEIPAMLVESTDISLGLKETCPIRVSFSDGGSYAVSYKSENKKIATVDENGTVTAKTRGTTAILVTSEFGNETRVHVKVKKAPESIKLSAARKLLGAGETLSLKAKLSSGSASRLNFSSSNEAAATVDAAGQVHAVAAGTATITAKTYNGRKSSIEITVKPAPEHISFGREAMTLGVGEAVTLPVSLNEGSAGSYSFSCENSDVLTVDAATGAVNAIAPGEATVVVTAHNGVSAALAVTVKPAPSCVSIAKTSITIGVGEKIALPEIIMGAEGEDCAGSYSLKSSNKKYASISDGMIKGVRSGSAQITVTTHNGKTAKLTVKVKYAPSKITLKPKTVTLGVGQSHQLSATLSSKSAGSVTYTSDNDAIAGVTPDGRVTAAGSGTATITAKTYNGKTAKMTVTVKPAPEGISFSNSAPVLGVGQTFAMAAALNEGSAGSYSFSCDNSGVISVDPVSGVITALKQGSASVTATAYNGVNATAPVTVKPAPSCVSIAKASITIGVGEKIALPEITMGAEGEDCAGSYSLKSSNKKYASISDGMIKGVRSGSAQITVTTHNGKTAKLTVKVKYAPSKITLSASGVTLGVGEGYQLSATLPKKSAGSVTYTSDNAAVASVTPGGYITAAAPGTAKITAKTYNGKTAKMVVTVKPAPESISLSRSSCTLGAGETLQLGVILSSGSAGRCNYESLNPAAATIDAGGKITAVAPGEAVMQVKTYNNKTAQCTVTVKPAPEGVSFREESLTLSVGDSYQLQTPAISGKDAYCSGFTYKSSASKYVKVSADGKITALRTGTRNITVRTYNGKTDTLKVLVKAAPKTISFAESSASLFIGLEYTPKVKFSNSASGSYKLVSSNPGVAAVSADGRSITAVSAGDADITATSFNGKTAVMKLHVPALPTSIALKPGTLTLGAGDSYSLKAEMPDGSGCRLAYNSSDPFVAGVSADGKVSAYSAGTAEITVHTTNGLSSSSRITVVDAPTRLKITPRSAARSLDEGSLQLGVSFGAEGEGGRVSYTSSDAAIASVSGNGKVSFHAVGSVRITAKTYNGHTAVCDLTIGELPGSMRFAAESASIALGDTITVPVVFDKGCESFSYSISDSTIASVSGDRVTALAAGNATLIATSRSGLTASCTLNVVPAPTGISLEPAAAEMVLMMSPDLQLNASVQPDGAGSVYYTSSNPSIAAVDYDTGMVTARGVGSCTITATTYNGMHSAQSTITVRNLLDGVKIGIDPGHQAKADTSREASSPNGGKYKYKVSGGASGCVTGKAEYVLNLEIAFKLRDMLESLGAEVYMTRESHNVNISNQQRAKMMNELGVDMVLRIHLNSTSASSSMKGMCIFVRKTGVGKEESAAISKLLLKHMVNETGAKNLGVKYSDDYTGLNWSTVPSLLLELGFLSNPSEDRLLATSAYQEKLARGMVNGICEYMGRDIPYK